MSKHEFTLAQLAECLDAELHGEASTVINGLSDLGRARSTDISFLSSKSYQSALSTTEAAAVVLKQDDCGEYSGNALFVSDPYRAYAKLSKLFETRSQTAPGIHETAVVADSVKLGANVSIGPACVVGNHAVLGDGVELCAGVIVGDEVSVGRDSLIHPNVVLYHQVQVGERVIIHANTSIGSDGFGFAPYDKKWEKIHQLGRVLIGDDVEIGANVAIDRGAIGDTVIGSDVIIDNQVHIAHNCSIGDGTAIAGCVGIAGSTHIGKNCLIGGACAISGHLHIADNTVFHGATAVTKSIREPGVFASLPPLQEQKAWRKNSVRFKQLDAMHKRLSALEKLVEKHDNNK